ncbi:DNA-processing protein DprA [Flavobacterium sp. ANB]|uniref:DNA-processing protein DprA n=1 Tax=unclassified Flavobacterium TaxID=196869 RepID=UPI0012BA0A53|nr:MULTISPECIES: DNA-processing protein DprA [unclassified Flavobacterium]MBF4516342.1 DNA-processing protein DprA [Flavobacterium sp. ANB]MTD69761.1 DNA-binding protein [Flavobacterium sp. LC2016-13]
MNYTENSLNIITAKSYKGIGNAWIVKNIKGNENIDTIISLLNKTIKGEPTNTGEFESLRKNLKTKLIEKFKDCCDGFVAVGDPNFPQYRGNVKDSEKPVFLYYKGNIDLLSIENKNISVIGLLNPEGDIEERERKIVADFVKNGATIVSGLAFGCDSISHQQALDSNGNTVAILPSPLNNILPAKNKSLAFQIVEEGGLLVTEYGNDFKSPMELSSRYKERDRLQALFCDTIVLAASYAQNSAEKWKILGRKLDSGARLAMGYAKEYNIPRAVMYDQNFDENNPMFDLNRELINEQKDITIISNKNIHETVKEIITKTATIKNIISSQTSLFS